MTGKQKTNKETFFASSFLGCRHTQTTTEMSLLVSPSDPISSLSAISKNSSVHARHISRSLPLGCGVKLQFRLLVLKVRPAVAPRKVSILSILSLQHVLISLFCPSVSYYRLIFKNSPYPEVMLARSQLLTLGVVINIDSAEILRGRDGCYCTALDVNFKEELK